METIPPIIKDLAEAFNRQVKYSNQIWLAVIIAAVVATFPRIKDGAVDLPFSLGTVDSSTYTPMGFLILTVLILTYCQAFAQTLSVANYAQSLLNELKPSDRRYYDSSIVPSFVRVAPLANLLRSQITSKVGLVDRYTALYYGAFKMLANLITLGIPAFALTTAYRRFFTSFLVSTNIFSIFVVASFSVIFFVTLIAMLQIAAWEIKYARKIAAMYWHGEIRPQ